MTPKLLEQANDKLVDKHPGKATFATSIPAMPTPTQMQSADEQEIDLQPPTDDECKGNGCCAVTWKPVPGQTLAGR